MESPDELKDALFPPLEPGEVAVEEFEAGSDIEVVEFVRVELRPVVFALSPRLYGSVFKYAIADAKSVT